jgi:V8-like Glu-specific endopeptidase
VPRLEGLEERVVPSLSQVGDTSASPYNGVVSLVAMYNDIPGYVFNATGAFIDQNHILTAAHELYNPQSTDNGGFPDEVDVLVGRNGSYASYDGQIYGGLETYSVPQAFVDAVSKYGSEDAAFGCSDVGIVTVSSWPAHFNFGVADNADRVDYGSTPLYSLGYPADQSYFGSNPNAAGQFMYQTAGYADGIVTSKDGTPLLDWQNHDISDGGGLSLFIGGQSGSPVFGRDSQGNYTIAGVFIGSNGANGTGYATAMTSDVANWVQTVLSGGGGGGGGGSDRGFVGGRGRQTPTGATTIALFGSTNAPAQGSAVSFYAEVSSPGGGIPTGVVDYYDGGNFLGQAQLVNGQAVFTTSSLGLGAHSITATYDWRWAWGAFDHRHLRGGGDRDERQPAHPDLPVHPDDRQHQRAAR